MGLEARVGSLGNLDVVVAILKSLVHSLIKQDLCIPSKFWTMSLRLEQDVAGVEETLSYRRGSNSHAQGLRYHLELLDSGHTVLYQSRTGIV